jgi:hypothetical protein
MLLRLFFWLWLKNRQPPEKEKVVEDLYGSHQYKGIKKNSRAAHKHGGEDTSCPVMPAFPSRFFVSFLHRRLPGA